MLDWKLQLIADTIPSHALTNSGHIDSDSLVRWLQELYSQNLINILGDRETNTVIVVFHKHPFVGDFHVYTTNTNVWKVAKCLRKGINWLFTNTALKKLEVDITDPDLCAMGRRLGFIDEGIRKQSYYYDDALIDVYNMGLIKR